MMISNYNPLLHKLNTKFLGEKANERITIISTNS